MKRIALSLIMTFFISSNVLAIDSLEFDPLTYKLGMTYIELKEKGIKDKFYFLNFSETYQKLGEETTDTFLELYFCEGSNYDGKAFKVRSKHYWGKEKSLDFLGKYRGFFTEIFVKGKAVKINIDEIGTYGEQEGRKEGVEIKGNLTNGETWILSNAKFSKSYGRITLVRINLAVCESGDLKVSGDLSELDQEFLRVLKAKMDTWDESLWEESGECLIQKVDPLPMVVKEVFIEHKGNPDDNAEWKYLKKNAPDGAVAMEEYFGSCGIK